ncbi:Hypp725 [Branchiostoma lanceolatum]|uniref:Hypp725 protein n=1 Tax=Branchiostoma lanceolatum TaxID=7740 RepID=A0A8J9VBE5_BRALA|nr:Hypp725 [Branchiostoma lanceolatum]
MHRVGRKCTVRAGNETVRAGNETVRAGNETVRAGNETVRAGNETVRTVRAGDALIRGCCLSVLHSV